MRFILLPRCDEANTNSLVVITAGLALALSAAERLAKAEAGRMVREELVGLWRSCVDRDALDQATPFAIVEAESENAHALAQSLAESSAGKPARSVFLAGVLVAVESAEMVVRDGMGTPAEVFGQVLYVCERLTAWADQWRSFDSNEPAIPELMSMTEFIESEKRRMSFN